MALILHQLDGTATHRLIASRFPPIGVFDFIADAQAAEAALVLEGMTSERIADTMGRLARIPPRDRVFNVPGAHQAMAAFIYGAAGRFNDEDLGAWYAALDLETAIAETEYHHTRRLRASAGGFPNRIQMRELLSRPKVALVDIRAEHDDRYHATDYTTGQAFGRACRKEDGDGILYRSVRRTAGENLVLFKPRTIPPITQGAHLQYEWDRLGKFTSSLLAGIVQGRVL